MSSSPTWRAFDNPAISLVSSEWLPSFQSPLAIAYLVVMAVFVAWLWWRARGFGGLTSGLVVLAFLAFAALSLRNIVFVGPVVALAIASLAPDQPLRVPLPLLGLVLAASLGAAATWAIAVGPARNEPILDSRLVDYALRHPPPSGHIATYAGVGSYMLWRSPRARVELDGWLEHFSAAELRETYAVLDGRLANPYAVCTPASHWRGHRRSPSRDRGLAHARLRARVQDPGWLLPRQASKAR